MKAYWRILAFTGILAIEASGPAASPAHAQAVGFGYASPGLSFGVGTGGVGYLPGYPAVVAPAPYPYVVAPRPIVLAPPPVFVRPPYVVARPFYGGYYGGRPPYPYPYRHRGY
jgi:hypothetical protein